MNAKLLIRLVVREESDRHNKLISASCDLHLLNHLQVDCSLLVWQKIAQFESDFFLMLAAFLRIDSGVARRHRIIVLFFGLLFSFYFSLDNSIVYLYQNLGNDCLLVDWHLERALDRLVCLGQVYEAELCVESGVARLYATL